MTNRAAFLAYARDFELAFITDQWDRLEKHFCLDAERTVSGSGVLFASDSGRDAVVAGLKNVVHALDRRFDVRIAEVIEGPIEREDGLFMRWRLSFVRHGLRELEVEGEHLAVYRDGLIVRIEEGVDPEVEARVDNYLASNDAALRPVASAWAPPDENEARRIHEAMKRTSVRAYAAAKSQQDIEGALAVCAEDFSIDTVPFGIETGDRKATLPALRLFFDAFPDYRAETEGMAVDGDQVGWWGSISVTSGGPLLGIGPTGRSTTIPAFSVFDFRDQELVRERFSFDLMQLCEGLGLPFERVTSALSSLQTRESA